MKTELSAVRSLLRYSLFFGSSFALSWMTRFFDATAPVRACACFGSVCGVYSSAFGVYLKILTIPMPPKAMVSPFLFIAMEVPAVPAPTMGGPLGTQQWSASSSVGSSAQSAIVENLSHSKTRTALRLSESVTSSVLTPKASTLPSELSCTLLPACL